MKPIPSFDFVHVASVRRAVVPDGDIREDIAFQNEINNLLARFDGGSPPLTALDWVREPVSAAPGRLSDTTIPALSLRLLNGGVGDRIRGINDIEIDVLPPRARAAGSA